jgi:hypothetical protein
VLTGVDVNHPAEKNRKEGYKTLKIVRGSGRSSF